MDEVLGLLSATEHLFRSKVEKTSQTKTVCVTIESQDFISGMDSVWHVPQRKYHTLKMMLCSFAIKYLGPPFLQGFVESIR